MEELALTVPGMWADHHVLAVRDLLQQDAGVAQVSASARDMVVHLTYEASLTSAEQISERLSDAGYAPGERADEDAPPTNKPAWASAGIRVTATDPIDLVMSGDHRKY